MAKFKLNRIDLAKLLIPLVFIPFYFYFHQVWWRVALYAGGWYLGLWLLWLDKQELYKWYYSQITEKDEQFAKLITRSILFIIAWGILTVFMMTSSGSGIGKGIVLGIGLGLMIELWQSRNFVEFFNQYFVQADKGWTRQEIQWLVWGFTAFWGVVSVFSFL